MQEENRRELLEDVVIDVMLFLPVKSLLRLRCVSKFWHAFIKNPTFINTHFQRRRNKGVMLLVRSYLPAPKHDDLLSFRNINSPELEVLPSLSIPILKDLSYDFDRSPENIHLLGPYSGLVCLARYDWIIICNPALREFKLVPPCPFLCPEDRTSDVMALGFGNSCTNDVKVVLIRNVDNETHSASEYHVIAHSYNLSTDTWREVDNVAVMKAFIIHNPCSEVFFNGICHWNSFSNALQDREDSILCFSISSEVFTLLVYPDCLKRTRRNVSFLTVLNEHIATLRFDEHLMEEPSLMECWMMTKYGVKESWIKKFVIGPVIVVRPLIPWRQDEWLLMETSNGQLASYAMDTYKIERFEIYGSKWSMRALIYKESLITLYKLV